MHGNSSRKGEFFSCKMLHRLKHMHLQLLLCEVKRAELVWHFCEKICSDLQLSDTNGSKHSLTILYSIIWSVSDSACRTRAECAATSNHILEWDHCQISCLGLCNTISLIDRRRQTTSDHTSARERGVRRNNGC